MWHVRKDFGKKPLVRYKWEEKGMSAFLSCRHYVGFELKLMTKPFVFTHRVSPESVRDCRPGEEKAFCMQEYGMAGRCAVNFCSNI